MEDDEDDEDDEDEEEEEPRLSPMLYDGRRRRHVFVLSFSDEMPLPATSSAPFRPSTSVVRRRFAARKGQEYSD